MTRLNERIVGAIFLMLSSAALADGQTGDAAETITVANLAPSHVEVVPPIPEPQRYLQRYAMEYQSSKPQPFDAQLENFYSAQVPHDFRLGGSAAAASDAAVQPVSGYLQLGPPTTPLISLVDLPDSTLTLRAQPQRRLSVTVDDWIVSATARIAVLHSHSTGATVSVRHGF